MTRNTTEISKEQQKIWYDNLDKERNKLFLCVESNFGVCFVNIGYSVLKIESGVVLITGGLGVDFRDKGIGKILFKLILNEAKKYNLPIQLEVLQTNARAKSIYKNLGFVEIGNNEKLVKMELVL
ncbi:GNAT family N-acetyltransferase [Candidatus Woesearchaeota archaeon]|nr:GNAT family N-acetyltransferase [Candidatus Woesearchaeota archaeon]